VEADRVAILVKQLDACETDVVLVAPCVQNGEGEPLASGKFGNLEFLVEEVEPLLETKLLWLRHLRLDRLTRLHVLGPLLWRWLLILGHLLLFLLCKLV